jgi:hypothetical protein
MSTATSITLAIVFLAIGCSSGFNRGEMQSALRAANPVFTSSRVEEVEALQPQISLPFSIAVTQPLGSSVGDWSSEDISQIKSWGTALAKAGVASKLDVIPASLVRGDCWRGHGSCSLEPFREAAARLGADTLLLLTESSAVDPYVNPLSILNLTIIGMWIAPGHHRDALDMIEGVLIDNRNEYLYVTAQSEAEAEQVRPFAYTDEGAVQRAARLAALESFGREFVSQASQLKSQ